MSKTRFAIVCLLSFVAAAVEPRRGTAQLLGGRSSPYICSPWLVTADQAVYATENSQQPPLTYYLPYVMHVPLLDGAGDIAHGKDGAGKDADGMYFPRYDTLIGISNPADEDGNPGRLDVMITFKFFDRNGKAQRWSDGRYQGNYRLKYGHSIATTLISGNVFGPERNSPCPPQDFIGYGLVEVEPSLPIAIWAMLGGGGFWPDSWNKFSAELPVRSRVSAQRHTFPYLIPFFEDQNHSGESGYRTGMVITNFDAKANDFKIVYRVADFYSQSSGYEWVVSLGPGQMYAADLYTELLKAGYPAGFNSEGHVTVTTAAPVPATVYLLISNRMYDNFSVGQGGFQPP